MDYSMKQTTCIASGGLFEDQRLEVILDHFRKTTDISFDVDVTGTGSQKSVSGRQIIIVH